MPMNYRRPTFCLIILLGLGSIVSACSNPTERDLIASFPDMPAPTTFTRAYKMTESVDGHLRVYAQEDGDDTNLWLVRKQDHGWSQPQKIDFPKNKTLTTPSFSPDGTYLYYASDAVIEEIPGRSVLNIWRVPVTDTGWGEPEVLPVGSINTGASELSPAVDLDGHLYFSTRHSRGGAGSHDVMEAMPTSDGWDVRPMPHGFNDFRSDDHVAVTPDGQRIFFYSHRSPKYGAVDIWTSSRNDQGEWQTPENLGPIVNTSAIEFGAGVSPDGEIFYFSRDGVLMEVPLDLALSGIGKTPAE